MSYKLDRTMSVDCQKKVIINKLDVLLNEYKLDKVSFDDNLVNVIKTLQRRRKEFDATRFFVLVVGPVKSGKSTLVNIFARKYVSPTAYRECTALPTIVGKLEQGKGLNKITQYSPTTNFSSIDAQKETFDYIVDVIRGIETEDILRSRVTIDKSELNDHNIKESLTLYYDGDNNNNNNNASNDLVALLGVEGNGFIDDEIMVIDMPGLDGSGRHQDNVLVYSNMAKRADVVFFVQSTASAINKASIDFLKELFSEKQGQVPVWLIHNIHDSQYFLQDDDKKKQDIKEQIEIGQRRIRDDFGVNRFESVVLNLGKIYTEIHDKGRVKEEYRKSITTTFDEYKTFETELIEKLKTERQIIKDKNNVGKAIDEINDSVRIINDIISNLNNQINTIEENTRTAESLSASLDNVRMTNLAFLDFYDRLLVEERIQVSWEAIVSNKINAEVRRSINKIKGKDLNFKIAKLTGDCVTSAPINSGTQFRTLLVNSLCKNILDCFNQTFENIRTSFNNLFNDENKLAIGVDDLIRRLAEAELSTRIQSITPISVTERKWGGIASKKYTVQEQRDILNEVRNDIIDNIPSKLEEYRATIGQNFIAIKDSFITNVKGIIDDYSNIYVENQNQIKQEIENKIKLLSEFRENLLKQEELNGE